MSRTRSKSNWPNTRYYIPLAYTLIPYWVVFFVSIVFPTAIHLGVSESTGVEAAGLWHHSEVWKGHEGQSSAACRQSETGKPGGWGSRQVGHRLWQECGEVKRTSAASRYRCEECGICWLTTVVLLSSIQATQVGGGSAVLRPVCRGSPGPGWLVVPSGAPAGWRPACPWRPGPGVQPYGLT